MNPALPKTPWHYIYLLNNKVKVRKQFSQAKVETWPCAERKGWVNPALPKTPWHYIYKREKSLIAHESSLIKLKLRLDIARKGRAG